MNKVPDIKFLSIASECLKALAHPVRLRVLFLLETERLSVGEIAKNAVWLVTWHLNISV